MPVVDRARVAAALPGYSIGSELGSGAFGLVLAGHHRELDRQVAVKVLSTPTPEMAAGFRTEARVLSRLDHPHIVRTYDYVARGDLCLLVMEQLPGGTLAGRRLRPEAACALALAIADALALAHQHGVLHRDVKPANILFTETGQPKITDFGISKVMEGSASTASRVIGTPRYMAPEQITGDRLSPATDIYALGVILYELLAGVPLTPPALPLPVLLRHHTEVVPPAPPGVPKPLADVVMRSLAKHPEDRQQSARAFAADLARAATKVFGRHWIERSGMPIQIADDIRNLTTSWLPRWIHAGRGAQAGPFADGGADRGRGRGPLGTAATATVTALVAAVAAVSITWVAWGRSSAPPAPPPPPAWQPTTLGPGMITTVLGAGTDGFSGDGGPAVLAELNSPRGIALDLARGYIYIADTENHRVRRVDRNGVITTVAGNGTEGFDGDGGPATSAQLSQPSDVAVSPDGSLYIADLYNHRIRRVDSEGIITTIAGVDTFGFAGEVGDDGLTYSGDGLPAVHARLNYPNSLLFDSDGSLYVADGENHRVRRISPDGIITTVAGTGAKGYGGDGGPATAARLSYPNALAWGPDGSLYIGDQGNYRVRRVAPDGTITTVAGTGEEGSSGDGGPATEADIYPVGTDLAVDAAGNIYFSEPANSKVRRIDTEGVITTIAGTGVAAFSGNGGPATQAEMIFPSGLEIDDAGILYIVDGVDNRVRGVRLTDEPPCTDPACQPKDS